MNFVGSISMQAVHKAFSEGPRNKTEGMRMIGLFFNNIANQPGCRLDYFGNVIGCTTQQDYFATQEFIMTSLEGKLDSTRLLESGCTGTPLQKFVNGLSEYVSDGAAVPMIAQLVPNFEEYLGR